MYLRLATQIRTQIQPLVDQYDAQLRLVPGYANIPEPARRDWEHQVLMVIAGCLEAGDDTALVRYIDGRAEQLLARGFEPEWLQQAIILNEQIITPLIETVAEGNFVWRAINRAQAASWQIIANERRRIALTLRESELRYQTIFNSTPIMFWLKDTHNRTLRINRAAADLEGVNPADVEGKSAYQLYPREQAEAFYQDDLAVINSGQPKLGIIEQHTATGTGQLMWLETGKTPVRNDQGETIGVLAFAVDITERKQAEEALRQSAESQQRAARYLRATIEATNELAQTQDNDTLYRRTVELAREKFDAERCGLYLLDESLQEMTGTYGTDDQRRTVDEHNMRQTANEFEDLLIASTEQLWIVRERPYSFLEGEVEHVLGMGWVAGTVLRGAARPIGILFNDRALTGQAVDTAQQEALAVYCAAVGSIIERRRAEEERRAAFENERIASNRLRAIVTATDELIRTTDLDVLYRRAVELAREKLGVERCALYILDESREWVLGTFGTDAAGQTTDERSNREPAQNHQVITMPREQQWVTFQTELKYWEGEQDQMVGTGWNVATAIRSAAGPIGIMFNDAAISRKPYDEGLQQSLALYCSMLANIIENKQLERQIRESLARRSVQVQTSTEVAQEIASAAELSELFQRVVTLIKERFNYYHAQLFRYEPDQDAVVLLTGYGETGQKMLTVGHKLQMGRGVVGTAAATGQSILAADVRQDTDWRPNPHLPDTRGELAVPITLGRGDSLSQLNALKYFDSAGLDGYAVAALNPEAVARLTHDVLQRGKPVVAVSYDLEAANQTTFIAPIEYELGRLLGEQAGGWARQHLPDRQSIKLGLLTDHTSRGLTQREIGILEGIQSVLGEPVRPVVTGAAIESQEASYQVKAWLRDHQDLNMIVAYNDATALGAYQAAQGFGWRNPDQYFIGGIDALPEALAAISQGSVYQASVSLSPEVMGRLAVRALVAAIKGIPVKPRYELSARPVNRSNAANYSDPSDLTAVSIDQDSLLAEALSGMDVSSLRLGLSVVTLANPFFAALAGSAQQEAQRLGVQLVVNEPKKVLGILDVQSAQANTLTDDDRLLLEGLCGQIASALESTRLLESTRQAEQLMRTVIDATPDWIFIKDQEHRYRLANQGYATSLHLSPEDFIDKNDLELGFPEELVKGNSEKGIAGFWADDRQVMDSGETKVIPHDLVTIDGILHIYHTTKTPLFDVSGQVWGVLAFGRDITERKRAEEELARSAQLLDTIINTSRDLIYIKNTKSEILLASQALAQLVGAKTPAEVIGKTDFDFFPHDMAEKFYRDEQNIIQSGQPILGIEEPGQTADGQPTWMSTTKIPFLNSNGEIEGIVGIGRDITERKRADQRMAETLRETERLYAAVSAEGWQTYRQSGQLPQGYRFDRALVEPAGQIWEPEMAQAVNEEKTIATQSAERAVAVTPLTVRGAVIGALGVYDNPSQPLQPDDLALLEVVSEQVALALESARLFEQTQRDAERERTINRITGRIRSARSVEEVLAVATQELRLATQASRSAVDIAPHTAQPIRADASPASGNGSKAGDQGAKV